MALAMKISQMSLICINKSFLFPVFRRPFSYQKMGLENVLLIPSSMIKWVFKKFYLYSVIFLKYQITNHPHLLERGNSLYNGMWIMFFMSLNSVHQYGIEDFDVCTKKVLLFFFFLVIFFRAILILKDELWNFLFTLF